MDDFEGQRYFNGTKNDLLLSIELEEERVVHGDFSEDSKRGDWVLQGWE
jgi:hypothetical protein